jgi:glutamate 5-kinase
MISAPVVVKLGSSLIAEDDGRPRTDLVAAVAAAIAEARAPVAIVSSGAIALGRGKAGSRRRIPELAHLQAASALGQTELQLLWQRAFADQPLQVAQVLLTARDLTERRSYLNVRSALTALFELGAVPVINENDATATDEISFGDNDILAAQTAVLLRARRLVLLTNVEGILASPPGRADAALVTDGGTVTESMFGAGSNVGRGGVASKVAAARLAAAGGVETFVSWPQNLPGLLAADHAGTRFAPRAGTESAFKLWLRYGTRIVSRVTIDDGAARAIRSGGASLLAVGVAGWSGDFRAGEGLLLCDQAHEPVARGLADVDSPALLDRPKATEVVHRDRMVVL